MRVTLCYPGIGILGFNCARTNPSGEAAWINHGMALIGASLKQHGHEVNLIDLRTLKEWSEFREQISILKPDVFGIGCSYLDWKIAQEAFRIVKEVSPAIKIIAGGLVPSIFPDEVSRCGYIDHIVIGEGELVVPEILKQKMGRIVEAPAIDDLDALPFADRELFDYRRELACGFAPDARRPHITMVAGRGCTYNCHYCQPAERAVFRGKFRMRSPENVVEELRTLRDKYAFQSLTFWDDTFTIKPDWIMQFCDLYQEEGFTQKMAACCRADIICNNEDMVKRLAEVGMEWLVVGFETGSDRLLSFINKGVDLEQNYRAAEICRRYRIKVFATAMTALPTETLDETRATIGMLNKIRPEHTMVFIYQPIPGTTLGDYCFSNRLALRDNPLDIERTGQRGPTIQGPDYKNIIKLIQEAGY